MEASNQGAAAVVEWMLSEGRKNTRAREFGDEMCRRIVAAGIPIWRGFCYVATLHPEVVGSGYIWNRDDTGANRLLAGRGLSANPEFTESPIAAVRERHETIRRKLIDPVCPLDFSILRNFRDAGGTDYIAIPMVRSDGEVNVITFLTDHAAGFSDTDIAGLESVAQTLGVVVELQSSRRIAKSLLDTYVGRRTAQRVLSGAIARGSGEKIRAVIWDCDLRGFTGLAETLPSEPLIRLLNQYFEIMAEAVINEGGEVLKFIGDGMLAIFEIGDQTRADDACRRALAAARKAVAALAQCNSERALAGEQIIRFGLALHLDEVYYGNIGAPNRLDFTVIGRAVNHASRLEKLSSELGRVVVASSSFAAAVPGLLQSLGFHNLRGVAEPQEVFSPIQE